MPPSMVPVVCLVDANTALISPSNPLPVSAVINGSSAITIADGADVTQGATTDPASALTNNGLLKNIKAALAGPLTVNATIVQPTAATSATTGPINCTAVNTLFAANPSAKGRKIYNPATNGDLYVLYGSGALTNEADCSFTIHPGQLWECPVLAPGVIEYSGIVKGLLASGTNANRTEV